MKKCEVLELMELQLGRREREERCLRHDLDLAHQEMNALKIAFAVAPHRREGKEETQQTNIMFYNLSKKKETLHSGILVPSSLVCQKKAQGEKKR